MHWFALSYLSNLSMNMWDFALLEYVLWHIRHNRFYYMQKAHLNSSSCNCVEHPGFYAASLVWLLYIILTHGIEKIRKIISVRRAYYTFMTGCVEFNYHFIKWHSKLWRAPGAFSPTLFFWLLCTSQMSFSHFVLPLGVYILFSASPPAGGENFSLSKGRWKV